VLFCIADHYEPDVGGADLAEQLRRVDRWVRAYPALAARHRDADGRPPRYTFFYPAEVYQPDVLARIAELCRAGYGEVEVQLHHDGDTSETLARKLDRAKADFSRHGLLARDAQGAVRFGFVHGNWALDNSRPDGKWCGVNDELTVLARAGCYADFTLPSAPSLTQTRKVNSLYYAADDPARAKSHDTGRDVAVDRPAAGGLLIMQGPLSLNWRRRKYGVFPRIDNADVSASNPPTPDRVALWVREAVGVRGRPDWVFIKVHAHGARPDNADMLLDGGLEALFAHLETAYQGRGYALHYMTARELYNVLKAAEAGRDGSPGAYRDYVLAAPGAAR
jgi:hypothetical protein